MATIWALLLLVVIKYYILKLPGFNRLTNVIRFDFSHAAVASAYFKLIDRCLSAGPKLPAWINLLLVILPIVSITFLLDRALLATTGEVGEVLLATLILCYCFDTAASMPPVARSEIAEELDVHDDGEILVAAHEQMFGIIFWFVLFGPAGVVLYWVLINEKFIDRTYTFATRTFENNITRVHGLAAWLPARITGLIYALVGNFITGFECWLKCMRVISMPSSQVLLDCGQAALAVSEGNSRARQLVTRALIVWLVFGVLVALIAI